MDIEPDLKDWTWVLDRPCPECGFEATTLDRTKVPGVIRDTAAAWPEVLRRDDATVRPAPTTWSPLEYGCHVRDVHRLFAQRLDLMLTQDDPLFENWDQDETAVADAYGDQDPLTVAAELAEAADRIAAAFTAVDGAQWDRTGRRSNGSVFTVTTFAQYYVHDIVHHLRDVGA